MAFSFLNRDLIYYYAKERRLFGRQCIFGDHNELLFDEPPNKSFMDEYILKNPSEMSIQHHEIFALSECETINPLMKSRGMNHPEGGWPKDINPLDEEQTTRLRKKIMRDDIWAEKVPSLAKTMEKAVLQNGVIDIYEKYFEDMEGIPSRIEYGAKTVSIFKDEMEDARPISSLTWSSNGLFLAGSYSTPKFMETLMRDPTSYIWNIENSIRPFLTLNPQTACLCLQYNARDQFLLAGGLVSGQVSIFDQRIGGKPILLSEREVAHSDRVNSLLWTTSKTNTEFFSGSADGVVLNWDTRMMATPTEELCLDPVETNDQVKQRSYGASVLEFEPTIPTRFMIGTDQGYVFSCNRKGKTAMDKIIAKFKTNTGCVCSLERNPAFPKYVLVVGDWSARIWSEEWRDAAIIRMTDQYVPVLSGTWSKTRCSLFFITKYDGSFEAWDLLIQQDKPIVRIKMEHPLYCCAAHEQGELIATGDSSGFIYLVRVSDSMAQSLKNERPAFMLSMEREVRREKAYDSRLREIKLKMRQDQEKAEQREREAEEAYRKEVEMEEKAEKEEAETQRKKEAQEKQKKKEEEQKKEGKEEEQKKKEEDEEQKKKREEEEQKKMGETEEKQKQGGTKRLLLSISETEAPKEPRTTATSTSEKITVAPHDETSGPSTSDPPTVIPREGHPPPPTGDEAEVVVDLIKEGEDDYYKMIEKEKNKRDTYQVIPVQTPFDDGFDLKTIMKPEDIEAEHKQRIKEIKEKVIKGLLALYRLNNKQNP